MSWFDAAANFVLLGIGWSCRMWWVAAVARKQEYTMMTRGTLVPDASS